MFLLRTYSWLAAKPGLELGQRSYKARLFYTGEPPHRSEMLAWLAGNPSWGSPAPHSWTGGDPLKSSPQPHWAPPEWMEHSRGPCVLTLSLVGETEVAFGLYRDMWQTVLTCSCQLMPTAFLWRSWQTHQSERVSPGQRESNSQPRTLFPLDYHKEA